MLTKRGPRRFDESPCYSLFLLSAALVRSVNRHPFWRRAGVSLIFVVSLLFFVERGLYRGIRYQKSYDFATVYAAAGCWSNGVNPYENSDLERDLTAAGAPQSLVGHQEVNPSLYFVSALPLVAILAWLPWSQALLLWYGLLLASFALSLVMVLSQSTLSTQSKWLAASGALLFCPTYVAFMYGNPSALTASLTALAICLRPERHSWLAGISLGLGMSLKPQMAVLGIAVFAVWRCWFPIWVGLAVSGSATAVGVIRLISSSEKWAWWQSQQHNIGIVLSPGGKGDPSPLGPWSSELLNAQTVVSLFIRDSRTTDISVWLFGAIITLIYLRRHERSRWKDVAFFAAVTTTITYHHYYDGQIFVLLIPLLVLLWKSGDRRTATLLMMCLLLLAFPSQTILARLFHIGTTIQSWAAVPVLRHQPLAVIALSIILAFSKARAMAPLTSDGNFAG